MRSSNEFLIIGKLNINTYSTVQNISNNWGNLLNVIKKPKLVQF